MPWCHSQADKIFGKSGEAGYHKDLTENMDNSKNIHAETGNCAWKVSVTRGIPSQICAQSHNPVIIFGIPHPMHNSESRSPNKAYLGSPTNLLGTLPCWWFQFYLPWVYLPTFIKPSTENYRALMPMKRLIFQYFLLNFSLRLRY